MQRLKKYFTYTLLTYFIYVFIFAFLVFLFHPLKDKQADSIESFNEVITHDRVALIESTEDAISVRLDLIEDAEHQIDFAYYRWSEGKVSNLMLGSILEAADRGVQIRILLDGLVQLSNTGQLINDVFKGFKAHPNIDLRIYEPFNPLNPIAWNHRMHDKMMLVDQEFALTGGRNIQDRFYLDDLAEKDLVRDREVLVYHEDSNEPTAIEDMTQYYNQLWNYQYTTEKYQKLSQKDEAKGLKHLADLRVNHPKNKRSFLEKHFPMLESKKWADLTLPTKSVSFVSNDLGRFNQKPKAFEEILTLAEEADESVFIQSPYFIPSRRMLNELDKFQLSPEHTTLFTNSEAVSPNLAAISAYSLRRPILTNSGADVVEFQGPGSSHAKSAIFDERISVVGTFNIDPRSAYINTESMVIIDSQEFAEELKGAIGEDFDHSLVVAADGEYLTDSEQTPAKTPLIKKLLVRLLSVFTPFFEHLL